MGEKQDDTNSLSGNYADLNWNLDPVVLQNTGIKPKKKRTIGQKILIAISILIGCAILGLCMIPVIKMYNKSKVKDDYYVQREMMEYLEERYGEKFAMKSYTPIGYSYNSCVEMFAYPVERGAGKYTFQVQGYLNKWGKLDYYDTYVMVKLVDEYENYLNPIIGEYFDDYKFYIDFHSEWVTSNLPPDTQVEDLWNMQAGEDYPIPDLYIYVAPNQVVDIEKVREVCESLKNSGLRGLTRIWGVKDEERYANMSRNDWAENMQYKDFNDIYTIFIYNDRLEIMEEMED